jgi:phosphoenolpyruvate synthase/pyruvate phosphate dikinase
MYNHSEQDIKLVNGNDILSRETLVILRKWVNELKLKYGHVDIEWAVKNGRIYILQLRPITA